VPGPDPNNCLWEADAPRWVAWTPLRPGALGTGGSLSLGNPEEDAAKNGKSRVPDYAIEAFGRPLIELEDNLLSLRDPDV